MNVRHASIGLAGSLLVASATAATVRSAPAPSSRPPSALFTEHVIDSGLAGGYQVVVADMNRDGKPDVIALASDLHELRWYENPGWQRHVIISGINAPINVAAYDIDGDGIPEIALARGFDTEYASSPGIVSILSHQGDPTAPWAEKVIDHLPTSHRLQSCLIKPCIPTALFQLDLTGRAICQNINIQQHFALLFILA